MKTITEKIKEKLSPEQEQELLNALKQRFDKNMARHKGLGWSEIQERLVADTEKLWALSEMQKTGGEPDVVGLDKKTGEYIFNDCALESPAGRRNTCYDNEGQQAREKQGIHPQGNALDMAAEMGIEILNEDQYRELQKLGNFDTKTSSWILTPPDIRKAGGALFCDRRYGHVFVYHNSAPSFYGARGFRGLLRV